MHATRKAEHLDEGFGEATAETKMEQLLHSCPTDLGKWLRGRDLNPRPLGYECNFLITRSFVFKTFVQFVAQHWQA